MTSSRDLSRRSRRRREEERGGEEERRRRRCTASRRRQQQPLTWHQQWPLASEWNVWEQHDESWKVKTRLPASGPPWFFDKSFTRDASANSWVGQTRGRSTQQSSSYDVAKQLFNTLPAVSLTWWRVCFGLNALIELRCKSKVCMRNLF